VADALAGEFETLQSLHSDVHDIVKAPEYAEWLKGQAPSIQRIVQENSQAVVSAADTALVFDKFKADTGWGKARELTAAEKEAERRRAEQLDAGRSATGGSSLEFVAIRNRTALTKASGTASTLPTSGRPLGADSGRGRF
jgi:hypothetical protein